MFPYFSQWIIASSSKCKWVIHNNYNYISNNAHTQKNPRGPLQMSPLAFYKKSSIYCFLNLFSFSYLCLHVDYSPYLASVNYCLTAKTSSKGSAPTKWHDLNITNFMTFVLCSYHHEIKCQPNGAHSCQPSWFCHHVELGLVLFYIFVFVNKSCKKIKTNNFCLSVLLWLSYAVKKGSVIS